MSEKLLNENSMEEEDSSVPQVITDEFFKSIKSQIQNVIKDLREKEEFQTAREFIRLFSLAENLQMNLKDEQARIQELTENHVDATGRIEQAMLISQKDQTTIRMLREEVIEAWKISDACKTREVEVSERLEQMRKNFEKSQDELKMLTSRIDDSEGFQLGEHKVTVLEECTRLTEEIRELNKRLQVQRSYSVEIQKKLDDQVEKNRDLFHQWDGATNEGLANRKKIEVLNHTVEMMEEEMDKVSESLLHYKSQAETRHARLIEREKQLTTTRENLEKSEADNVLLTTVKSKLELKLKICSKNSSELTFEVDQIKNFMRLKEDENRKLVIENAQNLKKIESLTRKIAGLGTTISRNEKEQQTLRNEIITAEKESDSIKRSYDVMKRENENLSKKIGNFMHELEKREELISDLKNEKTSLEVENKSIESELRSSNEREKKASQLIKNIHLKMETIESEKSFLEESINEMNSELQEKDEKILLKKQQIDDLENQLANCRHQQSLSVKQLKDTKDEYQRCQEREADIRDRWMKSESQIENINSQLSSKVAENVNLLRKIKKLEKVNRELKRDLEKCQEILDLTREEVKAVRLESRNLKETLRENDARFVKMKNQIEKILRARDLIANQMVRKNEENDLLEREVSMLKVTIERGNGVYNERLDDINVMRNEIKTLRSQCNVLKRALQNTADMRHEVFKLHRNLNQERCRSKVLEDEMKTPMNVHRWRKLNNFDPKRGELLRKCQRLQRKVLMGSAKVAKAQEIIEFLQNKLETHEKDLIKRPNAEEKLLFARSKLQVNTKRMKAAIAISRANIGDVISKDQIIEQLKKDLNEVKSQVFKEKHEKLKLSEKLRAKKKEVEIDETKEEMKIFGSKINKNVFGSEMKIISLK